MPGQKIGERIKSWFRSWPVVGKLAGRIIDWQDRREANRQYIQSVIVDSFKSGNVGHGLLAILYGALNEILGTVPFAGPTLQSTARAASDELEDFTRDPQAFLQRKLHDAFAAPGTRAFTETVGTIITEPVLALLEQYAGDANPDPHAMARSFHGIASGLPWASGVVDSVLKTVLGNRAPEVGKHIMALYWGLGLGFLGWQTLAPLLTAGLQPNLERYYNKLYRPTRFTPSQMSDLFALGERSATQMQEYLREQGWLDSDIASWVKLSYRNLPESGAWELFHKGLIGKAEMDRRLRALGYDPAEIPLLYKINEKEDSNEARAFSIATAKAALKKRRIGVDEFRAILTELRYQPREIELLIQLLTAEQVQEDRELSTSQIRQLYENRVIGRDEARHNLEQIDYASTVAEKLLRAWDNEALPKAARINKSTILEAFTDGVLSRGETIQMLQEEAGYDQKQAEFLVKVEEATRPKPVETPEVAAASLALLADFVQNGLITRAELAARAEIQRFRPEDRERIIELMFLAPATVVAAVELEQSLIESAYIHGVITRDVLLTRLIARGISAEDAEIVVRTVELENPSVFGEFRAFYLVQPSLGAVQLALQRGMLDEAGFRARLEAQGYSADAIEIALFNAQYQAPAEPKQLTKGDVLGLYRKQILGRAEVERRLLQIGYTAVDVGLLIRAEELAIEDTQASDFFLAGFIDQTGFVALLEAAGYTAGEIEDFFIRLEAGEIA